MTWNPAQRGIFIDVDGTIEDVDRHADDLASLGCYEDALEHALLHTETTPVSDLLRNRLRQDGLIIR